MKRSTEMVKLLLQIEISSLDQLVRKGLNSPAIKQLALDLIESIATLSNVKIDHIAADLMNDMEVSE